MDIQGTFIANFLGFYLGILPYGLCTLTFKQPPEYLASEYEEPFHHHHHGNHHGNHPDDHPVSMTTSETVSIFA